MSTDTRLATLTIELTPSASREVILSELRTFGLIGQLHAGTEFDEVTAWVAYRPQQGLIVAGHSADSEPGAMPAQELLDTLAARLQTDLWFSTYDGQNDLDLFAGGRPDLEYACGPADAEDVAEFDDSSELDNSSDSTVWKPAARELHLVYGKLPLALDPLPELALNFKSALTVIPGEGRTAIFPTLGSDCDEPAWSAAARPVITVSVADGRIALSVHNAADIRAGPLRERLAQHLLPGWVTVWEPVGDELRDPHESGCDLQSALLAAESAQLPRPTLEQLDGTGIEFAELNALIGTPLTAQTLQHLCELLGVESHFADYLQGIASPAEHPDAIAVGYAGLRGVMKATFTEVPEGDTFWARWRQLPHRRPKLAAAVYSATLLVAAGLGTGGLFAAQPWAALLWILATVVGIDAVGDLIMLRVLRRSLRQAR